MKHLSIKDLSEEDRPREKLLQNGVSALSNAELLAIVLGSGNREQSAVDLAKEMLKKSDNDLNKFGRLTLSDLTQFKGVGEAKAIAVIATLELGRRRKLSEINKTESIKSSKDVFDLFNDTLSDLDYEEFWAVFLNRGNKILRKYKVSQGGLSGTVTDVRLIIKEAILQLSSGIILVHNHPSGNLKPSEQDIELTKKISDAAKYFDINVLDHLIIGTGKYYSFADEGVLPS